MDLYATPPTTPLDVEWEAIVATLFGVSLTSTDNSTLAARTVIQLDGDHQAIVPVTATEGGIAIEEALLDFHLRNVQAAITYRTSVLSALVDLVRRRSL